MWTTERILALAPDPASAKAGQGLASPRKWVSSGQNDRALWGECQGSGSKPYQTQIDLTEPAFKCSCPSRKFPCKHALGLLLMLGPSLGSQSSDPPQWVKDWLATRDQKAQKKQERAESPAESTPDPAAQAQRAAARFKKISAGVADLSLWLQDLVRQGLAQAQSAGDKFWSEPAARMVDAQAPGLARMIQEIGETVSSGQNWQQRALSRIARLFLITESFKRLDQLPPDLQSDVKTLIGIPTREEDLAPLPALTDTWAILGQRTEQEDKLRVQRTWLQGQSTNRYALILEFSFGGQPLKSNLIIGGQFTGDIVYYPSAYPTRAIIRSRAGGTTDIHNATGFDTLASALDVYSDALAKNPFIDAFPIALANVRLVRRDPILAIDRDGQSLPLSPRPGNAWPMIAIAGGHPVTLFGEFDGRSLTPMSILSQETLHGLC